MQLVFLLIDVHSVGGIERVTANLVNNLVENGHQVSIVSLSGRKSSNIFTIDSRVGIEYLNFNFESVFNIPQKIASVFRVNRYIKKYTEKTVILGLGIYPSLILAMLPKRKNIKTIGCQHNTYVFARHIWFFLRKLVFHRLNALVSLTPQDLPKLKKLNQKSFLIPNFVSVNPDKPAQLRNKIILAIGRIDHNKGYDLLLDVFEKITLSHPDWNLRIIGDGPLREKIIARVKASGLNDRVQILYPTDKIIDQYLQASIYIMTSRTEGFGMVLAEAQACGLPTVSFDCETGPSNIIVDNENGFLVECFDIEKMAQKISLLCSDFDLRVNFGKNALKNVVKFSPEAIFAKWDKLFKEIIQ